MKKRLIYILIFLVSSIVHKGYSQGLLFYGNEKRIAERSSFQVFTKENIPASTGRFCISFEYAIHNDKSPGYILYLKNADGEEAFNLTYVYEKSKGSFMFAQDGKQIYYTKEYDDSKLQGKWMFVSLDMDLINNRAEISIGDSKAILKDIGLKGKHFTPQPFFGMCNHILETASFSIRNLIVSNGKESWNFPLNESQGEAVHDSKGNIIGQITNPVWLINHSFYWKPLLQYYSLTPSGFAFTSEQQRFYIYNRDSIMHYNIHDHVLTQLPYAPENKQLPIRLGMNLIDESQDVIYAYEMNWMETYVAEMNPKTGYWKTINQDTISLQLHHHSGLYLSQKHQFLFFGGYGNRRYYNMFITYNLPQMHWDTIHFSGDRIPPRFFASMAMSSDEKRIYIYGGKGNETGDQNVGIRYYYDLYLLDLESKNIKKLWEQTRKENCVPTRNMILSEDEKFIYLLTYPEYKPQTALQLYRLSVSDGSYEALGDSIPLISEEIATNANLYFNSKQGEFYCVIQEFEKYGQSETRIYSLAYPPVSLDAMRYYDKHTATWYSKWFWLPLALCFMVVLVLLYMIIKRNLFASKQTAPQEDTTSQENILQATSNTHDKEDIQTTSLTETVDTEEEETKEELLTNAMDIHRNKIVLFGSFIAFGRNGRDITYMFSPKIRHIFLYILVNSVGRDGVLSSDMNNLFWPDKSDDKAKNLKNVTISHLRKTLQELDGIELTHQKGYFKIVFTDECYCDYQRMFTLTDGMHRTPATETDITELYKILAQGKFLATIENSLFDYFKQQVEQFTLSFLSEQIHFLYKNGKDSATIRICNILFTIDPVSDIALAYAICTYRRQNRLDKAMRLYGNFVKEYQRLMGEEYPIAFEKVEIGNIRI